MRSKNRHTGGGAVRRRQAVALSREYELLILIVAFGLILTFWLFKGLSNYGDDFAYVGLVPQVLQGGYAENINIFSLRPMLLLPLSLSIAVLGYTDIGAGMYGVMCYVCIIIATYVLGKEMYDARAGLIAAFLFSFYPIALLYNSAPSPMMPLVLFLLLSIIAFRRGMRQDNVWYYWLSGVFTFMGALTDPLGYVYAVFYVFYIFGGYLWGYARRSGPAAGYWRLMYFVGIATSIAALAIVNIQVTHTLPFYELSFTNSYYSAAGGPDEIYYTNPSLTFYLNGYFSYNLSSLVTSVYNRTLVRQGFIYAIENGPPRAASQILNRIFNLSQVNISEVGLFPYAVVILCAYLLYRRERKAYFLILWAAVVVAYMEFGTMSLTHYFPIYKLMRFTAIAAVPFVLIMGIAISKALGPPRRRSNAAIAGSVALIALLLVTSLPDEYWFYIFNHNGMQFMKTDATILLNAPGVHNSTILAPALDPYYLLYYMHFPYLAGGIVEYDNGSYGGQYMPNCSQIPPRSYLIIPSQSDISYINSAGLWSVDEPWAYNPSQCGLKLYADVYNNSTISNSSIVDRLFAGNIYYKG